MGCSRQIRKYSRYSWCAVIISFFLWPGQKDEETKPVVGTMNIM